LINIRHAFSDVTLGTHVEHALDVTTAQTAINHGIGSSVYYLPHHDRGLGHVDLTDSIVSYGFGQAKGVLCRLCNHSEPLAVLTSDAR
jgi:hypothetical protein